jgi:spore coat polysaccharide biosynthesis protein SpsF
MSRLGIVVQARMGSSRLPGKVMQDLAGAPALERLFERLRRVRGNPLIVLATSTLPGDNIIADYVAATADIKLWRGPEQDVLRRYADAARHFDLDPIIRITSDCPLVEPVVIDRLIAQFHATPGCDYADNVVPRTFPHGFDAQVVSRAVLETADTEATLPAHREHVLPFVQTQPGRFRHAHLTADGPSHAGLRITLDYPEDLALIRGIYENLYPDNPFFGLTDILALKDREPALFEINRSRANMAECGARPVFVISGTSAGLGEALCSRLLALGHIVVCIGRRFTAAQRASDRAILITCDLSSSDELNGLSLDRELAGFDRVTFFSNAGVVEPIGLAGQVPPSALAIALHVNALAPAAIAVAIIRAAGEAQLTFVNISSGAAHRPIAGWSAYCAGKAAARAWFDCVAMEYPGIRVIERDPGVMDTGMQAAIRSHGAAKFPRRDEFVRLKDDNRLNDPGAVAAAILTELDMT